MCEVAGWVVRMRVSVCGVRCSDSNLWNSALPFFFFNARERKREEGSFCVSML